MQHEVVSFAVSSWSSDPHIRGAWSQLAVGGTPLHRRALGEKISERFILAGEACHEVFPAMVHGAALSGIHAANEMCNSKSFENIQHQQNEEESVVDPLPFVIIGAGAAGLHAAAEVQSKLDCMDGTKKRRQVIVLEAKDRHGGRVHTVSLSHASNPLTDLDKKHGKKLAPSDGIKETSINIDIGASWLQQFPDNFLVDKARNLKLDLQPTDFQSALCAASDGIPLDDLHRRVDELSDIALQRVAESEADDLSVTTALCEYIESMPEKKRRECRLALFGDINSDFGYTLHDTSAKHALMELGIGNNDHYIKQGYGSILDSVAEGLNIQYNCAVSHIDWSQEEFVRITTSQGDMKASHCICTVPVSILSGASLTFHPQLPSPHLDALRHIKLGKCEKVVLRYSSRWWPHSENGFYRWYDYVQHDDNDFPWVLNWNEWLDVTDCVGYPVIIGFCVGEEACEKYHGGRGNQDIAEAAAQAFEKWALHRNNALPSEI